MTGAVELRSATGKTRRMLTVQEAADYLGVSKRTMQKYIEDRLIPVMRKGRIIRIDQADLDIFIDRHKI